MEQKNQEEFKEQGIKLGYASSEPDYASDKIDAINQQIMQDTIMRERKEDILPDIGDIPASDESLAKLENNQLFLQTLWDLVLQECENFQRQPGFDPLYMLCQEIKLRRDQGRTLSLPNFRKILQGYTQKEVYPAPNQLLFRNACFFPTRKLMYGKKSTMSRYYSLFRSEWFSLYDVKTNPKKDKHVPPIWNNEEDKAASPKTKQERKPVQTRRKPQLQKIKETLSISESNSSELSSYKRTQAEMKKGFKINNSPKSQLSNTNSLTQPIKKKKVSPSQLDAMSELIFEEISKFPLPQKLARQMIQEGVFNNPSYKKLVLEQQQKHENQKLVGFKQESQRLQYIFGLQPPRDLYTLCKALEDPQVLSPFLNVAENMEDKFKTRNLCDELTELFDNVNQALNFIGPLVELCKFVQSATIQQILAYVANLKAQGLVLKQFLTTGPSVDSWKLFLYGSQDKSNKRHDDVSTLINKSKVLQHSFIITDVIQGHLDLELLQFLAKFESLDEDSFNLFKQAYGKDFTKLKQFTREFMKLDETGFKDEMERYMDIALNHEEKDYQKLLQDPNSTQGFDINEQAILEKIQKDICKFKEEMVNADQFKEDDKIDLRYALKVLKNNAGRQYGYQVEIVKFCVNYLNQRNHLLVQLATGHGKSIILQMIADVFANEYKKSVYICCPNDYLTFQSKTLRAQKDDRVGSLIHYGVIKDLMQFIKEDPNCIVLIDEYDQILQNDCSVPTNKLQYYIPRALQNHKFLGISGSMSDEVIWITNVVPGERVPVLFLTDLRAKNEKSGKFKSHSKNDPQYIIEQINRSVQLPNHSAIVICKSPAQLSELFQRKYIGCTQIIQTLEQKDLVSDNHRQTLKKMQMLKNKSFILFSTNEGGRGVDTVPPANEQVVLHQCCDDISQSEFVQFIGRTTRNLDAIENIHVYDNEHALTKTDYLNYLYSNDLNLQEDTKGLYLISCLFSEIEYACLTDAMGRFLVTLVMKMKRKEPLTLEELNTLKANIKVPETEVILKRNVNQDIIIKNETVFREQAKFIVKEKGLELDRSATATLQNFFRPKKSQEKVESEPQLKKSSSQSAQSSKEKAKEKAKEIVEEEEKAQDGEQKDEEEMEQENDQDEDGVKKDKTVKPKRGRPARKTQTKPNKSTGSKKR